MTSSRLEVNILDPSQLQDSIELPTDREVTTTGFYVSNEDGHFNKNKI